MIAKKPIYLDSHATTPVDPRVLDAMLPYFSDEFGNAASIDHAYGASAASAIEKAREKIAGLINAKPEDIIFTSGATEADNLAIFGAMEKYADKGNHVITCVTEHKAILDSCKRLEALGKKVTYLPVDKYGSINLTELEDSITESTVLISIMAANNEIGTLAPIAKIGEIAKKKGVLFHTDAVQAVGHIPIDVEEMNIDLMSISAHKFYGPKGVGALYVRGNNPRVRLTPIIFGGGHERGLRSGTLNVPAIVGFGKAAELAHKEMRNEEKRLRSWTAKMLDKFVENLEDVELNGHPTERLPHNLNVYFKGVESKAIIQALRSEIAVSAGSACTTANVEPSHVQLALGFDGERAHSSIRFGLGRFNSEEEIDYATASIISTVKHLRRIRVHA